MIEPASTNGPKSSVPPAIYLASLADYNDGVATGLWVDALQPPEELERVARSVVDASLDPGSEEWVILDHEGFGMASVDPFESLDEVHRLAVDAAGLGTDPLNPRA